MANVTKKKNGKINSTRRISNQIKRFWTFLDRVRPRTYEKNPKTNGFFYHYNLKRMHKDQLTKHSNTKCRKTANVAFLEKEVKF